jgi:hypothetical protein
MKSLFYTWQPRRPPASPSPPCPPPPGRGRRTGRASPPTANKIRLQLIQQRGLQQGKTWAFRFTLATSVQMRKNNRLLQPIYIIC